MGEKQLRDRNILTYVIFFLTLLVETYTYVIPVLITYLEPRRRVFIVFSITTIPRFIFWGIVSWYFSGFSFWKKWFQNDISLPATTSLCIVYGFLFLDGADFGTGWVIAAVVAYPFLLFSLAGQVRCLAEHFPWNRWTLELYRLHRASAIIVTTIIELLVIHEHSDLTNEGKEQRKGELAGFTLYQVIFIGSVIGYYTFLYLHVPTWEQAKKKRDDKYSA